MQEVRVFYDSAKGRQTDSELDRIKGTIEHRERLWDACKRDFAADKDTFVAFFTIPPDEAAASRRRKGRPPKVKKAAGEQDPELNVTKCVQILAASSSP